VGAHFIPLSVAFPFGVNMISAATDLGHQTPGLWASWDLYQCLLAPEFWTGATSLILLVLRLPVFRTEPLLASLTLQLTDGHSETF
jgi:hypothetical protein